MKTLYVTDLDGTLLNSQASISKNSIEIINQLIDQGLLFTYATARSLVSASKVTKGLSTKIPVIAYNGAFIFNAEDGSVISSESFEEETVQSVRTVLEQHGISPMVYSFIEGKESLSWVKGIENAGTLRYLGNRKGDKRLSPLETDAELYAGDVFYFTCIGKRSQFEEVYELFSKDERLHCTLQEEPYCPGEWWLEVMPKKATKANAILKLKELWECDKIISFGDGMNDIPMFQISDKCYAMENAVDELKEIATGVIESNDTDGVAIWLEENVNI